MALTWQNGPVQGPAICVSLHSTQFIDDLRSRFVELSEFMVFCGELMKNGAAGEADPLYGMLDEADASCRRVLELKPDFEHVLQMKERLADKDLNGSN